MPNNITAQNLTIDLPMQVRTAETVASTANVDARTVDVVWTTGARVARRSAIGSPYLEELDTSLGAVRLGRLNAGAPVLDSHRSYGLDSVIGVVERGTAKLSGGEGRATVRFARDDEHAESIWRKVRDGIIRAVSVGYRIHKAVESKAKDGTLILRATDWEPFEISFVALGADAKAGVRAEGLIETPCEIQRDADMANKTGDGWRPGMAAKLMRARGADAAPAEPRPGSLAAAMRARYATAEDAETRGQHDGSGAGGYRRGMAAEMMRKRYAADSNA